jgi:type IV pilus modification protein PilV
MKHRAQGFTLVESLIGLLLLSLGLLGAWAMLLGALQSHGDARYRASATNLLRDMADRIRANPAARVRYDTRAGSLEVMDCAAASPCEPAAIAAADLAYFNATARALLPPMDLVTRIEFEPALGPAATDRYAIAVEWRGPRDSGASNIVTLQLLAEPVAG